MFASYFLRKILSICDTVARVSKRCSALTDPLAGLYFSQERAVYLICLRKGSPLSLGNKLTAGSKPLVKHDAVVLLYQIPD